MIAQADAQYTKKKTTRKKNKALLYRMWKQQYKFTHSSPVGGNNAAKICFPVAKKMNRICCVTSILKKSLVNSHERLDHIVWLVGCNLFVFYLFGLEHGYVLIVTKSFLIPAPLHNFNWIQQGLKRFNKGQGKIVSPFDTTSSSLLCISPFGYLH